MLTSEPKPRRETCPAPAGTAVCARPFAHSTAHCTARHSFLCPCASWECRRAPTLAIDHRMIVSPARSLYWRWMDAASGSLDQLASHGLDLERAILWRRRQRVAAAQGPSNAIQFQSKLAKQWTVTVPVPVRLAHHHRSTWCSDMHCSFLSS